MLDDRPSSNNLMQVRGRAERREFSDSFEDIFCFRLLYPSSGEFIYCHSIFSAVNEDSDLFMNLSNLLMYGP